MGKRDYGADEQKVHFPPLSSTAYASQRILLVTVGAAFGRGKNAIRRAHEATRCLPTARPAATLSIPTTSQRERLRARRRLYYRDRVEVDVPLVRLDHRVDVNALDLPVESCV